MASRTKAWTATSRARSSGGGPSSGATPASAAYALPPRPGAEVADEDDRVARRAERRSDAPVDVVEQPDDADLGRGGDRAGGRFVVERDVAAGDRDAEGPTGVAEAADPLLRAARRPRDGSGRRS